MDRIPTVNDWYDGPRLGIAEWNGVPHIYEAELDPSEDGYGGTFFLTPIEPELLALVLEDWDIWLRWQAAHDRGEVPAKPHGSMPVDANRHEVLTELIGDRFKTDPKNRVLMRGAFDHARQCVVWHAI